MLFAAWVPGRLHANNMTGYHCEQVVTFYDTKIDEFVCPPSTSQTVAVRIMKLSHRPRIA